MSSEVIFKCDHCGARCSGDVYASIGRWDDRGTIVFGKTVHGCSKEHLGFALAKMFGIGIDGKCDGLLAQANAGLDAQREAGALRERLAKLEDMLDLVRRYNVPTTEEALRDWFDAMRKKHEAVRSELEAAIEHGRKTIDAEMNARFALERDLGAKNDRVTELEKRIAELAAPAEADSGIIAKLEQKIKMQHAQIGGLEKDVARLQGVIRMRNRTMEDHVSRGVHEAMVADLRAKIVELEKRLAPVDANGKTLGDVGRLEYEAAYHAQLGTGCSLNSACLFAWESAAKAIIRAFGGRPKPATNDAAEALRRVRERITNNPYPDVRALRHVDAEIAKLEANHAQSPPDTSTESGLPEVVLWEKL